MLSVSRTLWSVIKIPIPFFELDNNLLHLAHADRVNPTEGLIHEEELRFGDQRPRDLQPPPLAPTQRVGLLLREMGWSPSSSRCRISRLLPLRAESGIVSATARMFCSTVIFRKTEASCGR